MRNPGGTIGYEEPNPSPRPAAPSVAPPADEDTIDIDVSMLDVSLGVVFEEPVDASALERRVRSPSDSMIGTLKRRPLEVAARSMAEHGRAGTVVDVIHGRALQHYAEGLRQYLAIRLGDIDAAESALKELRVLAAAASADELVRAPGVRARLFRFAREIGERRRQTLGVPTRTRLARLPWRRATRPGTVELRATIGDVRDRFSEKELELLELRYARELAPEEIAFVVESTVENVGIELSRLVLDLRSMVGASAKRELPEVLLEAFALCAADRTLTVERDEVWEPIPAGVVIGERYSLEVRVGSGSFADVYRAYDKQVPGHVVALKLLHQPALDGVARDAALRELRLIASVFHPSVVQFKDHGWYEGRLWFVMPWYEGETLEARIRREPLSRKEAHRIFTPLARALACMHAARIRHQDVKPENIFLAKIRGFAQRGEQILPVLLDLGVAATEAEMVVAGTPTYFAPEVAARFASVENQYDVGPKADVFALALAMRNSLEPDTQEDVPAGAVESFIAKRATTVPSLPSSRSLRYLAPHFERWMNLDPALRPSADELERELEALVAPEERKRRVLTAIRTAAPFVAAAGVGAAALVYGFAKNAEVDRALALRAQEEAGEARASLGVVNRHSRVLEQDLAELGAELGSSSQQLADTTGELESTRATLRQETNRRIALRDQIERARALVARIEDELANVRAEAADERQRAETLERDLAATQRNLEGKERDNVHARREIATLTTQLATAREELATAEERRMVLEAELATAQAALATHAVPAADSPTEAGTEAEAEAEAEAGPEAEALPSDEEHAPE